MPNTNSKSFFLQYQVKRQQSHALRHQADDWLEQTQLRSQIKSTMTIELLNNSMVTINMAKSDTMQQFISTIDTSFIPQG